jgi:hypothetical protein
MQSAAWLVKGNAEEPEDANGDDGCDEKGQDGPLADRHFLIHHNFSSRLLVPSRVRGR